MLWFLAVYYSGFGKRIAARLPRVPSHWSPGLIAAISPGMVAWGLVCAGVALRSVEVAQEQNILRQFPIMMLAAGVLLVVTGRQPDTPRPAFSAIGAAIVLGYVLIWMFNGRRSHAVIGVLTGACAWYVPRHRRPSLPSLAATAVALRLGRVARARVAKQHETPADGLPGSSTFLGDFDPSNMLVDLNVQDRDDPEGHPSRADEQGDGGVRRLSADDGDRPREVENTTTDNRISESSRRSYPRIDLARQADLRPRPVDQGAWMVGSEFPRKEDFTGPAISVLGATQLNGGAVATLDRPRPASRSCSEAATTTSAITATAPGRSSGGR